MIKSFKCRDTEKLFNDVDVRKFRGISKPARMKLEILQRLRLLITIRREI